MNRFKRLATAASLSLLVAWSLFAASPASADVRLPHVIGNQMVLQQGKPLPIWGWAGPGENVTVTLGDQKLSTQADIKGKWKLTLSPVKAGGPLTMTVAGKNTIQLKDILVGEVWVCSGQSNMAWPVGRATNAKQEVAAANYPKIRLLHIPQVPAGQPASDVGAAWGPCNPKTVPGFSAVGYFFGRHLHKELNVPVGIINTSWGGTLIEPWTPPVGFASVPKLQAIVKQIEQADARYADACRKTLDAIQAWIPQAKKALDAGKRVSPEPAWPQHFLAHRGRPTGLYNGMVHPLVPFGIRGALWYQGEANRADGMLYHEKMKALINGWRSVWAQGDFPFYFVQLAPFRYKGDPAMLARLWESQTATLSVPNTGMAVTVDGVDNIQNIHPTNKQDPGKRLALWALANVYGREGLVYSGPLYKSMAVEGNKIRLRFDHIGSGLASRDGKPLTHFAVAGADKKFVNAKAEIDGQTLVVSADGVAAPVAVRFGWHQEAQPNLSNKEGLPASPFRTDSW